MTTTLELDIRKALAGMDEEEVSTLINNSLSEFLDDYEDDEQTAESVENYRDIESYLDGESDWRGLIGWKEFEKAVDAFGYEIADIVEGCLVDSYLVYLENDRALIGWEYAVSGWASMIEPEFFDDAEEAEAAFDKLRDEYEQF